MHVTMYVNSLTNDMHLFKNHNKIGNERLMLRHSCCTWVLSTPRLLWHSRHAYGTELSSIGELPVMPMKCTCDARADLQGVQGSRLSFWVQIKPPKLLNQLRLPAAFCSAP